MKTATLRRIHRLALCLGVAALTAVAATAPTTASACGGYGDPTLTEEQVLVLNAATQDLYLEMMEIVLESKPARIEGEAASIWVKTIGVDDARRWRKVSLTLQDDAWVVRA